MFARSEGSRVEDSAGPRWIYSSNYVQIGYLRCLPTCSNDLWFEDYLFSVRTAFKIEHPTRPVDREYEITEVSFAEK